AKLLVWPWRPALIGGSVMIWGSMTAEGVGEMTYIDVTMDVSGYTKMQTDKIASSLQNQILHTKH
uniref:Uncharacterized protein n=1 Tax=Amphiprion percula TaxID=161767 RepID=A0A3P8S9Z9_AMPPE